MYNIVIGKRAKQERLYLVLSMEARDIYIGECSSTLYVGLIQKSTGMDMLLLSIFPLQDEQG